MNLATNFLDRDVAPKAIKLLACALDTWYADRFRGRDVVIIGPEVAGGVRSVCCRSACLLNPMGTRSSWASWPPARRPSATGPTLSTCANRSRRPGRGSSSKARTSSRAGRPRARRWRPSGWTTASARGRRWSRPWSSSRTSTISTSRWLRLLSIAVRTVFRSRYVFFFFCIERTGTEFLTCGSLL